MKKDKGGRPPNTRIKHIIPYIIKELKVTNAKMILEKFNKDTGASIALNTVKKYISELIDDGVVVKNQISKRIITYSLR